MSTNNHAWRRRLDAKGPDDNVHTSSRPPIAEALGLLPLAYRVGSYIATEKKKGKGAVFDMSGITLSPPNPGPYGGTYIPYNSLEIAAKIFKSIQQLLKFVLYRMPTGWSWIRLDWPWFSWGFQKMVTTSGQIRP